MDWRLKTFWSEGICGRRRVGSTRRLTLELLERRMLLSVNFGGGVLTVDGTPGNDLIAIVASLGKAQVAINGRVVSNSIPLTSIAAIKLNGLAGNDVLSLRGIDKSVTADGGAGSNQLAVTGHAVGNAFSLGPSAVSVNGSAYNFLN